MKTSLLSEGESGLFYEQGNPTSLSAVKLREQWQSHVPFWTLSNKMACSGRFHEHQFHCPASIKCIICNPSFTRG